jgi:hypothetical protein
LADLLGVDAKLLETWINPGRYVSGREFAEAGLAELVTLNGKVSRETPAGTAARRNDNGATKAAAAIRSTSS